jgi:hypothetical protein
MVGTPFLVFLVSALLIVCVFGGVAISTRQPRHVEYARAQRLRGLFFLSLGRPTRPGRSASPRPRTFAG